MYGKEMMKDKMKKTKLCYKAKEVAMKFDKKYPEPKVRPVKDIPR